MSPIVDIDRTAAGHPDTVRCHGSQRPRNQRKALGPRESGFAPLFGQCHSINIEKRESKYRGASSADAQGLRPTVRKCCCASVTREQADRRNARSSAAHFAGQPDWLSPVGPGARAGGPKAGSEMAKARRALYTTASPSSAKSLLRHGRGTRRDGVRRIDQGPRCAPHRRSEAHLCMLRLSASRCDRVRMAF